LGDLSFATTEYGYKVFHRNFFEISHAKGPQDAAGGFIKRQADKMFGYNLRHILKSHVCVLLLHVSYTLYAENNLIVFHSFQHSGSFLSNHRANWQSTQMKSLIHNLPPKHCICIHDYSENYRCVEKNEGGNIFYMNRSPLDIKLYQ
jgi:hypothetical protein